jgi:hypothetical protein
MEKMKLLATLVCAFGVLAFASTARAQNDDVLDEDHIDDPENGKYVFWDEEEMLKFLAEYNAELAANDEEDGGGVLDSCTSYRPAATAAGTYHTGRTPHWHVDTNVYWSTYYWSYYVCYNAHNHSSVYGINATWKTTQSNACDYCDQDDWTPKYYTGGSPATMTDTRDCWYDLGSDAIYYYGREFNGYSSGYTFGYENMALFDREGTSTDSKIMILLCMT